MINLNLPDDLEKGVKDAVCFFWETRSNQILKQEATNTHDQGNRGAVTGGKQLDGFVGLILKLLTMNGISEKSIFINSDLELPGYYRPNKKWDLLAIENNILIMAIEFKSQVGPSFGNNFNNRTEEAMGSALDIWTAYREGVFGQQKAPWLGYFMILEDCIKSNTPVKVRSPHFNVLPEFINTSYIQRYKTFCNKLILERKYNSACFITTNNKNGSISYNYPDINLSYRSFITSMLGALVAYINSQGFQP